MICAACGQPITDEQRHPVNGKRWSHVGGPLTRTYKEAQS
jgi:hypothetical protein